jgi:hypothetical protein
MKVKIQFPPNVKIYVGRWIISIPILSPAPVCRCPRRRTLFLGWIILTRGLFFHLSTRGRRGCTSYGEKKKA